MTKNLLEILLDLYLYQEYLLEKQRENYLKKLFILKKHLLKMGMLLRRN